MPIAYQTTIITPFRWCPAAQKPTQSKESVAETSLNLVAERVEQLKALLPEAISEGKVNGINYKVVTSASELP